MRTPAAEPRFAFGRNWRDFQTDIDEHRIRIAEQSLKEMLGLEDLHGRAFLDAGSGSGLFSLAAVRLGSTRVHSFDLDVDSVAATEALRQAHAPDAAWTVEQGDVTDRAYVESLGKHDVVYSWGVLHHTGRMWDALDNVAEATSPDGLLFVAIYNDQGGLSRCWRGVKRLYNRLPPRLRPVYTVAVMAPYELRLIAGAIARREPWSYVHGWTRPLTRGMSRWNDLVDWVGGYPFEVATPAAVFEHLHERGFALERLATVGGSIGCNEFVFRRTGDRAG